MITANAFMTYFLQFDQYFYSILFIKYCTAWTTCMQNWMELILFIIKFCFFVWDWEQNKFLNVDNRYHSFKLEKFTDYEIGLNFSLLMIIDNCVLFSYLILGKTLIQLNDSSKEFKGTFEWTWNVFSVGCSLWNVYTEWCNEKCPRRFSLLFWIGIKNVQTSRTCFWGDTF